LRKARPSEYKQERRNVFIGFECGILSAGETGRHLAVRLREDKYNLI
jgi:hypothetical protein